MYSFSSDSVDDLLRGAVELAISDGVRIQPSKGPARDLVGVQLALANPRTRLSRTETRGRVFSALGELAWYLSGSNEIDFIRYYLGYYDDLDEGGKAHGGYGPRLFGDGEQAGQVRSIVAALRSSPDTRKAVAQIFDRQDLVGGHKDIPCTCVLQFLVRNGALEMITYMRSNDIHKGLPHDFFSFTMLQELVARSIDAELGAYHHFVGSLHLYDDDMEAAGQYLSEGWQTSTPMEAMPIGDPWELVSSFLAAEQHLRLGGELDATPFTGTAYWDDLIRLLAVYRLTVDGDETSARDLAGSLDSTMLRTYALDRFDRLNRD